MYDIKTHRTAASLRSVAERFLDMARAAEDPRIAQDFKELAADFALEAATEDAKANLFRSTIPARAEDWATANSHPQAASRPHQ